MTSTAGLGLANLLVAGAGVPAAAHELRPGYLELRETTVDRYHVVWKQPARGDLRLAIDPVFPPPAGEGGRERQAVPGAFIDRMTIACLTPARTSTVWSRGSSCTRITPPRADRKPSRRCAASCGCTRGCGKGPDQAGGGSPSATHATRSV
jgi:hypothetical protein